MLPALLVACNPWLETAPAEDLRRLTGTFRSNGNAFAKLPIVVEDGEEAFVLTARAEAPDQSYTDWVSGPDGPLFFADDWWDVPFTATSGAFPSSVATFAWPWSARDPLRVGRHRVLLGTVDSREEYVGRLPLDVDVLLKRDSDLASGTLTVTVFYAGDTATDDDVVAATEEGVQRWQNLYEDFGVDVDVAYDTWDEGELDPPGMGSAAEYEALSSSSDVGTVNLVIAPSIEAWDDIFGIAGDIPGPLVPSSRSAVLISVEASAGPDGTFSKAEIRLYGETMAHETGHFLGLFHPVEIDWSSWDAFDDTPQCDNETDCIGEMGDHLMFAFPICGASSCEPQTVVTDDQAELVHRSVAVR